MRKLSGALVVFLTLSCLAGCETFKGVGRDVQKAGDWIEDTASR